MQINGEQPLWQLLALTCLFAGLGALLKLMVESVKNPLLKRATGVLSSGFWGGMAVILLSELTEFSPKVLLVLATVLGWLGFEATLSALLKWLERITGLKQDKSK